MPSRTFRRGKNLAHAPRSHPRGALPAPGSRLTVGISNGRDLLANVDGRGIVARRYRDIICAVASDQGGAEGLSEARLEELICVVGRRGGKSRAMATLACYLAGLCDYNLAPGQRGVAARLAAQVIALLPTALPRPAIGSSPSHGCRRANGAAFAPSACTRSSSVGSRRRRCCPRQTLRRCCSGLCSPPARSTCARSMAGKRSPPSPSISQLDLAA
jgi:hypothetical protein